MAVILTSTHHVFFITDKDCEYMFWLMLPILRPIQDECLEWA